MIRLPSPPRSLALIALLVGATRVGLASEGAWQELAPPARVGYSAILDPVRHRMVLVGGLWNDNPSRVWVLPLSSLVWTEVPVTGRGAPSSQGGTWIPPVWPFQHAAAIYDPLRDRMLVEGDDSSPTGEAVWSLDLSTMAWSRLATSGTPPPGRWLHSAIYDPAGDRMITFGGVVGYTPLNDVWVLSLSGTPTWTKANPAGTPPLARYNHGAILDPARGRMVVFGGTPDPSVYASDLNDVWALSLSGTMAWTQLLPSGTLPGPSEGMGIVADAARDRMLLLGGSSVFGGPTTAGQTWSLDFATLQWTRLPVTGAPGGSVAAILDAPNDRVITWSGFVRELRLSPTLAWRRFGPNASFVGPFYDPALCFDAAHSRMIESYGGASDTDYSPAAFSSLLYGYGLADTLWRVLDGAVPYTSRPSARIDHSAVVDPVRGAMIVFGGYADYGALGNDLWSFALSGPAAWTKLAPAGAIPSGRGGHAAIYDPLGDRMLLFGGADGSAAMNDLWSLALGAPQWQLLAPAGPGPSARQNAAAVYDPAEQRMLLFGGFPGRLDALGHLGPAFNELWSLDLAGPLAWTLLAPTGTPPPPTHDPIAVYNPDRGRVEVLTDVGVWALEPGSPPHWRQLDIANAVVGGIERGAGAYDPINRRILLFPKDSYSLWELKFSDLPTAVTVSLVRASAEGGRARLEWLTGAGLRATVQRAVPGGAWADLASLAADPRGWVTFEDSGVLAGGRYGYRLVIADASGTSIGGEAWLTIPPRELALAGAVPKPAAGPLTIQFTLAGTAPARLVLFDVAGREVVARDVGGLGPGPHALDLAPTGALAPGVYVLRLTSAGRALTTRVAIVR